MENPTKENLEEIIHTVTLVGQQVEAGAKSLCKILKSLCCWCAGLIFTVLILFLGIIFIACGVLALLEPVMGRGCAAVVVGIVTMLIGLAVMGFASACSKR